MSEQESRTFGPYATEKEAAADARDVTNEPPGTWREFNEGKLYEALGAAGVDVDGYAFEEQILCWLAGCRPEAVQVVIGWITRAGER